MSNKKQIFKLNTLKNLLNDENSCVSLVPTTRLLALPPFFLNDMKSGIFYILNSMLKKFDRSLNGIVIGYQNIKVLLDENTGIIPIGTTETEVNVSVEFYIFQPKIGNFLQGIVNKKSNNHIGCLVHQYFNATILKPEDVEFEDWICKDFNVNDKIVFKVKDLDFTSVLPYIEGVIEDVTSSSKVGVKGNSDSNVIVNDRSKYFNRNSISEENVNSGETKNESWNILENCNINKILDETESFIGFKQSKEEKKKKSDKSKGKSKPSVDNLRKMDESKSSNEVTSNSKEIKLEESHVEKKKKKKKKGKEEDEKNTHEVSSGNFAAEIETANLTSCILENYRAQLEDENSSDFVKPIKSKKEKNKKKGEEKEVDRTAGLSVKETDDSVFYSTLIDPVEQSWKKMKIPFCSPITADEKKRGKSPVTDLSTCQDEKTKKRKQKKRKREEEEEEDFSPWKKMKMSAMASCSKKTTPQENNLQTEKMMAELLKQQLERVKEELNMSDKEKSSKTQINGSTHDVLNLTDKNSKKKKKKKEKEKETTKLNGSEKSEVQNTIDDLLRQELDRVKKELKISDQKKTTEKPESLYDKLLKQAKNVVESPSEKKEKKISHRKQKTIKSENETTERVQNGSMYNDRDTPEVNFEKSLFTDSENSHNSPVKRPKEMNGSLVLNDFSKEKETPREKEKKKKSKEPEESLYEKLLREARSLLEHSPKKKKKK